MRRSAIGGGLVAAVLVALAVAQAPKAVSEEAYRANNLGLAYLEQYDYPAAVTSFAERSSRRLCR